MRYIRPDESLMFSPVTGTVDTDFQANWLMDGLPGYPAQTTGSMSLTVTPATAMEVDLIVVCHHNINQGATITLGGSLSSTIETQAHPPDGIPTNWYRLLDTPVSVSSLVFAVTGQGGSPAEAVIVGELYAGLSRTLPALHLGRQLSPGAMFPWEGQFSSLAPYDPGVHRTLRVRGTCILQETELNELHAFYVSQRNGNRPVIIVPDYPVEAAWLCQFNYDAADFVPGDASAAVGSPGVETQAMFTVTLEIVEIPRLRWP
jgi:hypothetical protein